LEPLDVAVESRGTSKSTVSRRFIARTQQQLDAWRSRPLDDLALAVLLLDGVHVGDHCLIVALGITEDGTKHALGLWEGSTENSTVCRSLLANLASRGLRTDRSLLVIEAVKGSRRLKGQRKCRNWSRPCVRAISSSGFRLERPRSESRRRID
jgi:putative transposase